MEAIVLTIQETKRMGRRAEIDHEEGKEANEKMEGEEEPRYTMKEERRGNEANM